MSTQLILKKISLVLLKIVLMLAYAIILVVTCFGVALWFASPFVLGYVAIVAQLGKVITLFGGSILYIWLVAIAVIFVPLLIYSIVYRIRQNKKRKRELEEALAKAKAEGEKDKS